MANQHQLVMPEEQLPADFVQYISAYGFDQGLAVGFTQACHCFIEPFLPEGSLCRIAKISKPCGICRKTVVLTLTDRKDKRLLGFIKMCQYILGQLVCFHPIQQLRD